MFQPHPVNDEDLVVLLGHLLPTVRNVAAAVLRVHLAHSEGVLVSGPSDVERIIAVVVSSLDSSSRDVTIGGVHPGQVTVPGSHENIVLLPAQLFPAVRDVAAAVVGVALARVEAALMVSSAHIERTAVTGLSSHHRPLRNVVS